jgi:hypothetical protein
MKRHNLIIILATLTAIFHISAAKSQTISDVRNYLFDQFYIGQNRIEIETLSGASPREPRNHNGTAKNISSLNSYFLGRRAIVEFEFDGENLSGINFLVTPPAESTVLAELFWLKSLQVALMQRGFNLCAAESHGGEWDALRNNATMEGALIRLSEVELAGMTYAMQTPTSRDQLRQEAERRGMMYDSRDLIITLAPNYIFDQYQKNREVSCDSATNPEPDFFASITVSPNNGNGHTFNIYIGN